MQKNGGEKTRHPHQKNDGYEKIAAYLENFFGDKNTEIHALTGDASMRRYFRVERAGGNFIVMDASDAEERVGHFTKIARFLSAHKIRAPKIFAENPENGFLILEDFGERIFLNAQKPQPKIADYERAIDVILQMQKLNPPDFLPAYDENLLRAEMHLFIRYFLRPETAKRHKNALAQIFDILVENALGQPRVFVHRDFHSRNLMILKNGELGVLDFQDAVFGAQTYDLVSLLKDVYIRLPDDFCQRLLRDFHARKKSTLSFADFQKNFDFVGLQRYLKILGIFNRLAERDGKKAYLAHIPLTLEYALEVAEKYPELRPLWTILSGFI